jgi:cytoskeleton protein RodZ
MSEVSTEEQVVEPSAPKPSVGERLRAAREVLGMEAGEVASALKLSKHQVEALETGDWSRLPGNTFVRGFVRNYARVVKLDAATLLPDLESPPLAEPKLQLPQSKRTVLPESGQVQRRDYAAVLAGMVLVAVAVVAYYVVPSDFWQTKPREVPPVAASEPTPLFPPMSRVPSGWFRRRQMRRVV